MHEYDLIADWYPRDPAQSIGVAESLAAVASLPRGSRVFDFGCGNGSPSSDALAGTAYRIVGLDSSAGMLARFRRNLSRIPVVRGDCGVCPFSNALFDAAISRGMLFHRTPRDQSIAFASVSRAGGQARRCVHGRRDSDVPAYFAREL